MKIYIPGNLLLVGEYAVTLQGGKGIGIAIDCQAKIESEPSDRLSFISKFPHDTLQSSPTSLIDCILSNLRKYLSDQKKSIPIPPLKVIVDTTDFYYPNGRKKGFGSSAAVTTGITYLLLRHSLLREPDILTEVFPLSLSIHREFQGGHGSGYDIATSLFGSAGVFTGGFLPTWTPLSRSWLDSLKLLRGDEEASTKQALFKFHTFISQKPQKAHHFFQESNNIVERLVACETPNDAKETFFELAKLNHWIHEELKISSEGPHLKKQLEACRSQGSPGKPVGAGGEIAAVLFDSTTASILTHPYEPLKISEKGLICTH